VQHRLSVAGGGAAVTFAPKALARVHQFTSGIPRLINLICDRSLLTAYSSRGTRVLPAMIESAAASLELVRARRPFLPGWLRQRAAAFAAGVVLASMIGGGLAAMWHYRQYATVLVQRVASRQ
jgi:general secretion pathway protein A